jgi:hypothetical protein
VLSAPTGLNTEATERPVISVSELERYGGHKEVWLVAGPRRLVKTPAAAHAFPREREKPNFGVSLARRA